MANNLNSDQTFLKKYCLNIRLHIIKTILIKNKHSKLEPKL